MTGNNSNTRIVKVKMKAIALPLLALSACAHMLPPPAPAVTYRCELEPDMCHLVDSAANQATRDGFLTVRDDSLGGLVFAPAAARTVFTGTETPTVNHLALLDPALFPRTPDLEIHGNRVEVIVKRGGLQRDGDIVARFIDIFEKR
jgi:hypothetical protein